MTTLRTLRVLGRAAKVAILASLLASSASAQVEIGKVEGTTIYLTVDTVGTVQALDQETC